MDDKISLLRDLLPKAVLRPLTPEAIEAVPTNLLKKELVLITDFPFKVGRESRVVKKNGKLETIERSKRDNSKPNNDLYLVDSGHRLNISREHFQIEKREQGYILVDRGSACGVKVNDVGVGGGDDGGFTELHDGDKIGIGTKGTPYIFEFLFFDGLEVVMRPQED